METSLLIFYSLISQEISKRIPLRMHANSLDSNTETLLSQDVAVSLLQENKMALKRCESVRKVSVFALAHRQLACL